MTSSLNAFAGHYPSKFYYPLSQYMLHDEPYADKWVQVINKTSEAIKYLVHVVDDGVAYKKIFSSSYNYLTKNQPIVEDSQSFKRELSAAHQAFEQNALAIARGQARKVMKVITNGILLITSVGLIANAIKENFRHHQLMMPGMPIFSLSSRQLT
jgi:hypothetical protein